MRPTTVIAGALAACAIAAPAASGATIGWEHPLEPVPVYTSYDFFKRDFLFVERAPWLLRDAGRNEAIEVTGMQPFDDDQVGLGCTANELQRVTCLDASTLRPAFYLGTGFIDDGGNNLEATVPVDVFGAASSDRFTIDGGRAFGEGGHDDLKAAGSNPVDFDGGPGADLMYGGAGDDTLRPGLDDDVDRLSCGDGHDTVKTARSYNEPGADIIDADCEVVTDP